MFGRERALASVAVQRRAIAEDPALSVEQRRAALAAAERSLPPALRALRAGLGAPARARAEVQALRRDGAGEDNLGGARGALRRGRSGPARGARSRAAATRPRARRAVSAAWAWPLQVPGVREVSDPFCKVRRSFNHLTTPKLTGRP